MAESSGRTAGNAASLPAFAEEYLAILDSVQPGIIVVDAQGLIILVNRRAEQICGHLRQQILGKPVTDVFVNTRLPAVLSSRRQLLGQKITLNGAAVMADYAPIFAAGQLFGAVSAFQDISLLENTANELNNIKSLSSELEAIINSSYDGMFITDGQGNVLRLNKAYERITGIRAAEIIGRNMRQLVDDNYYDQSVTLLVMRARKVITINQTVRGDQKILVTGNPVFNEQGELVRVVTNVRDITELVSLQEQLAQTQEQTLKYQTELSHLRLLQMAADIIYRSPAMERAIALALKVAEVDSNVLITGDSGTGKEVIAKLIHKTGMGPARPFIKINCAAIPEQLLESELFGYAGGAFTGARKEGKPGMFELAHNGTLFLDEVGDLPLLLQAKLLRAIQDKTVIRVGGTASITVNVRIIAATNQNLAKMAAEGRFRTDLYYRLMVVPIQLPPLRERREDIPLLISHFLTEFNKRFHYAKSFSPALINTLVEYDWPGNVRELENLIERLLVTSAADVITPEQLPDHIGKPPFLPCRRGKLKEAVEQTEAYLLESGFNETGSWKKTAELLGIDRTTAFRKACRYGLIKGRS
ncbi:MAG: sigma 54-interacting transcriptional regulator [Sporomusaceae bacterium]|nr:sigma 54-interacting transcriptional regulator [Sporomusaceae bacterium]